MKPKMMVLLALFGASVAMAQTPPPPSPAPVLTNAAPATATNAPRVVVPQVQVILGTPEAVGAMEANLRVASRQAKDAQKAYDASPSPENAHSMALAQAAVARAKDELDKAKRAYQLNRRAQRW